RMVRFTPGAVTQLVDDLRRIVRRSPTGKPVGQPGLFIEPMHLQVVCFQLWEKSRHKDLEIGVEELAEIGDVDSALGQYYAERVRETSALTGVSEKVLRDWFDRCLITGDGVRAEVMWKSGGIGGITDQAIDQLERSHLIRREQRR